MISHRVLSLLLVTIAAIVGGCGLFPERSTFTASGIDPDAYKRSDVVVLPVAVNPQIHREGVPVEAIQRAVASAIADKFSHAPRILSETAAGRPERWFPFTPSRVAQAGKGMQADGFVGVSVSAWDAASEASVNDDGYARVDLLVSFVDAKDPSLYWTMSGVYSAPSNNRLAEVIKDGLTPTLHDMYLALGPVSFKPWFSRQIFDEPLLTFFGPTTLHTRGTNSYNAKAIDLQVTAIDNSGITALVVANEAFGYVRDIPVFSSEAGERPIFLSAKVRVPLAAGNNRIVMKARSVGTAASSSESTAAVGPERVAVREVQVTSSAVHANQVIAVASAQSTLASDFATLAANRVIQAVAKNGKAVIGRPLSTTVASPVLISGTKSAQDGDVVVVYVVGVLHLDDGQLVLEDVNGPREGAKGRLTLERIVNRGPFDPRILVLDLCTAENELDDVRQEVSKQIELHSYSLSRVTTCDSAAGPLAHSVSSAIRDLAPDTRVDAAFAAIVRQTSLDAVDQVVIGNQRVEQNASDRPASSNPDPELPLAVVQPTSTIGGSRPSSDPLETASSKRPLFTGTADTPDNHEQPNSFVVAFSSSSLSNAQFERDILRRRHISAGILLGVSGYYAVVVAADRSVEGASHALRQMRQLKLIPDDAYVLPPSRVAEVIEPIALK